jgi:hypothetical protein
MRPDLKISNLSIQGGEVVTWTVKIDTTVWNDSTGPCNNTFWTDIYVRTEPTPPAPRDDGAEYQALSYLGANAHRDMTFDYTFPMTGTYYLYAQADTYENVSEAPPIEREMNNVGGPVTVIVDLEGTPIPTPEATATPVNPGGIAGTVWAFVGGQLVVPTQRVSMRVLNGGTVATTDSEVDGSYWFCTSDGDPYFCIAAGTGYTVEGLVIIDGTTYFGYQTGIQVLQNQWTSPVDIILFPI